MTRKAYHHGNLREELLAAGRQILDQQGMNGLSLRKVAATAGVSATAPYSHFKDKRELLAELAASGFLQLSADMQAQLASVARDSADTRRALTSLARAYIDFAVANPALFQLMFSREARDLMDFPALAEAGANSYQLMADCLTPTRTSAGGEADGAVAATAAWSLVHGLATLINNGQVSPASCGLDSLHLLVEQVCATLTPHASSQD